MEDVNQIISHNNTSSDQRLKCFNVLTLRFRHFSLAH